MIVVKKKKKKKKKDTRERKGRKSRMFGRSDPLLHPSLLGYQYVGSTIRKHDRASCTSTGMKNNAE